MMPGEKKIVLTVLSSREPSTYFFRNKLNNIDLLVVLVSLKFSD